jgi:hypothetical protein
LAQQLDRGVDGAFDGLQCLRLLNKHASKTVNSETFHMKLHAISMPPDMPPDPTKDLRTRSLFVTHILRQRWRCANPNVPIPHDTLSTVVFKVYKATVDTMENAKRGDLSDLKQAHFLANWFREIREANQKKQLEQRSS